MKTAEKVGDKKTLRSLSEAIEAVKKDGYTKNFMANEEGLLNLDTNQTYGPHDVKISNFYRFEGESDPGDSSILYAIETKDGQKGILTDSYGPYSDTNVTDFIKEVEEITKKPHFVKPQWVNISTVQRVGSIAAGALILLAASQALRNNKNKKGYILPLVGALAAGLLVYRGGSGHCAVKAALLDEKRPS
ncbi:MAG: hypothetical protein K0R51_1371 [Cytophagaceae bacterium]|jgi:hypothetical protein|nr:hypothetical protein [Cytophagaceae bacterium]